MAQIRTEEAKPIYLAAELFVERGLRQDDSIFTRGGAIWSERNARSL